MPKSFHPPYAGVNIRVWNIVTRMCDYRRGFGFGFIDQLQVVTTNNYNITANFHTLQFTVTYILVFSVCYSLH
jgi:hypothetical protein